MLLNLSAELRITIYGFLVPDIPLQDPRQYLGLFYACKQTRAELKPNVFQSMQTTLDRITKDSWIGWDDVVTFRTTHNLHEMDNLVADCGMDFRYYNSYSGEKPRTNHPLRQLFCLHLKSLTINFIRHPTTSKSGPQTMRWFWLVVGFLMACKAGRISGLQRFRLDWSEALSDEDCRVEGGLETFCAQKTNRYKDWYRNMETNDKGQSVGISFERRRDGCVR
ncbi:hypothetical protein CC86DRAFT_65 [Ophiobolus disseminans]|uniref:Uncharacterized protein n=1 Tax=Ophiobolus disseminans TaxID=1469910 RepID=A0A6A7AJ98_9PLEO|nr:hypothetical protein CC86DRAFT_65 [Ophiobolus disseminans]